MDRLAFNAMAAINEDRLIRQQLSNDIANVNTVAFKQTYEATLQPQKAVGSGFDTRLQPRLYTNDQVRLDSGALMVTGRDLDISLSNQTVLGVTGSDGQLAFTRRGDLSVSPQGVLENGAGYVVRGQDGSPITVPQGAMLTVGEDGTLFASDPTQAGGQPQVLTRLMLRDASGTALIKRDDGLFRIQGQAIGTDFASKTGAMSLTPQALEGSSVNPMTGMVRLIEQSRSFEQQVQVIKEAKSNDESGASMMRVS